MCVACIEFIKGTLNIKEFKSALRETTVDDPQHRLEIERTLGVAGDDADAARKKLAGQP